MTGKANVAISKEAHKKAKLTATMAGVKLGDWLTALILSHKPKQGASR